MAGSLVKHCRQIHWLLLLVNRGRKAVSSIAILCVSFLVNFPVRQILVSFLRVSVLNFFPGSRILSLRSDVNVLGFLRLLCKVLGVLGQLRKTNAGERNLLRSLSN